MTHTPFVEVLQPAQQVMNDGAIGRHPSRVSHDLVQNNNAIRHDLEVHDTRSTQDAQTPSDMNRGVAILALDAPHHIRPAVSRSPRFGLTTTYHYPHFEHAAPLTFFSTKKGPYQ